MIIDTHTHIYTEEFDADRADVVSRALAAGVRVMLLPGINASTIAPMLSTCRTWPGICFPLIGLHPEDVREDYADVLEEMEKLLDGDSEFRLTDANRPSDCQSIEELRSSISFIGIGEIGLDFYWDATYKAEQLKAFESQLRCAARYHLPVVIHQRAAFDELYALMESFRPEALTGIFHCFGGTADEAERLLSFPGFMLGIGGALTYKKSTLPDVLRNNVPLDRIVVETDAPYLAPVPFRGRRNEPAYIVEVVRRLADIYDQTPDAVAARTTANALRIFPTLDSTR
ncbi:MAG: TatD family hydrolase [Bacteroidaceae bacterium]|nr:TatD family hydrolase [Bacteroidaceae bacterium]